jgi:hypothetical protein
VDLHVARFIQSGSFENKFVARFIIWYSSGSQGNSQMRNLGILDEAQLDGSVDAASHSIFKAEVGDGEHRVKNAWNARCKKHNGEGDVEPDGNAEENLSVHGKRGMRKRITSSKVVRPAEEPSTIWEAHRP